MTSLDNLERERPVTRAEVDVLAERRRQIAKEGWSPEHDNKHDDGSLAAAGACYAHPQAIYAGALIIAEIERIDRANETVSPRPKLRPLIGHEGAAPQRRRAKIAERRVIAPVKEPVA